MSNCKHMNQVRLIEEHKLFGPVDWCSDCGAVKRRQWARGQSAKLRMVNARATWRLPNRERSR